MNTSRTEQRRSVVALSPLTPMQSAAAAIKASGAWPLARRLYLGGVRSPDDLARRLVQACPAIRRRFLVEIALQVVATELGA